MMIPTEPIGSIPRPLALIEAVAKEGFGNPKLEPLFADAIRDTLARFEATGSPVITDGEQRKFHNFWTYSVDGLPNTAPDGFKIPFTAGHTRRMPRLTAKPFRYRVHADQYLEAAKRLAHVGHGAGKKRAARNVPTARHALQFAVMTLSMEWMKPFDATMSVLLTTAPFTVTRSPLRPSVNSLPETVLILSPSCICWTADDE